MRDKDLYSAQTSGDPIMQSGLSVSESPSFDVPELYSTNPNIVMTGSTPESTPPPSPTPPPAPPPSPSCFLTTAVTEALGMSDTSEPLALARYLRDQKMTSSADRAKVELYYQVAPTVVARSTDDDWITFWSQHMRKITVLIKLGEYDLAKNLYTFATASLIDKKATRYSDVELVNKVYDFGLKGFGKTVIPYPVRFAMLKVAFVLLLTYRSIQLNLAKRKFAEVLDL